MARIRQKRKSSIQNNNNNSSLMEQSNSLLYTGKEKPKHINISDDIELISLKSEESGKETDVENCVFNNIDMQENTYFITTPKSPKDGSFYDYASSYRNHSVSTPGTVVSDFELDHTDFVEVTKDPLLKATEETNEKKCSNANRNAIYLSQLQGTTKNNILNETMLFMSIENKKMIKMNGIHTQLELKYKILENIPKLLKLKNKLKIPPQLIEKFQISSNTDSFDNNNNLFDSFETTGDSDFMRKDSFNRKSISPMTSCEQKIGNKLDVNHSNQNDISHKKSKTKSRSVTNKINSFVSSAYMNGSGIVGSDSKTRNIFKRSDGILVILKCSKCNKADFVSPQGIINHYRFKHEDVTYHNQASCLLQNMEFYEDLQSTIVLNKFKELDLNPKTSMLPFNVRFKEPIDLLTDSSESLDQKIEFFKVLDLGKVHSNNDSNNIKTEIKVGRNGKIPNGNSMNINLGIKKNNVSSQSIQVISSNKNLKQFLNDKQTNNNIVDEMNGFILNYVPVEIEQDTLKMTSESSENDILTTEKVVKKRKYNNETEMLASLPIRKGKRKRSIPIRLLED